jgi:hypothetical protein
MDDDYLWNLFTFHKPTPDKCIDHEKVRDILKGAALQLNDIVPLGHEKHKMIDALREVMFWANAGIACNP